MNVKAAQVGLFAGFVNRSSFILKLLWQERNALRLPLPVEMRFLPAPRANALRRSGGNGAPVYL